MIEDMAEAEKIIGRGLMIAMEEDTLLKEPNTGVIITKRGPYRRSEIIHTEVKADNQDSEVHQDPLLGDPELQQGHLA